MQADNAQYKLIEDPIALAEFAQENKDVEWMCFDTEFIGEKRFITTICLIQISTEHGLYLIDPLKIKDIQPVVSMLVNRNILKIVHAGDNDYRLFNTHFGIIPENTFDTQIAAAFLGYKYPVAFSKLVENELDIALSKGYTVTDWEQRPFKQKQLTYAIHDVIYLYELWQRMKTRMEELGRMTWAQEEFKEMENPEIFEQDPYKEAIQSNLIKSLRKKEQVFLLRLLLWRTNLAKERNHSKEMVLPGKYIGAIVRAVHSGLEALKQNRRLPDSLIGRHGADIVDMYQRKATEEEMEVLKKIPRDNSDNPKQDILMEMLDLLVRYKCLDEGISHHLVLPRSVLKRMKNDKNFFDPSLENGWRKEFLGEEIVSWFKYRRNLEIEFTNGKFELKMQVPEGV
ncbi:MAG: HRDC domain-containing protein [Lewinellaceae bacterium]|nr:HRDC domain-containing protein [Saprospiraceae bacterium]MCB9339141.1 HRDC domain-containing protein [Lewinellaceae bacterium]